MLVNLSDQRDLATNKLVLVRRWFGACASAQYLKRRVLVSEENKKVKHAVIHVALSSALHEEIDLSGNGWKDLFLAKSLRFGFILSDESVIESHPIWAIKHQDKMELVCLDLADVDESKNFSVPRTMILADDSCAIHRIPVVEV